MDILIIYGPQGCGKTSHADELRQHFYCEEVVSDHAFRILLQGMQVSSLNLLSRSGSRLLVLTNDRDSLERFLKHSITHHGFPKERVTFCSYEEAMRALREDTFPASVELQT